MKKKKHTRNENKSIKINVRGFWKFIQSAQILLKNSLDRLRISSRDREKWKMKKEMAKHGKNMNNSAILNVSFTLKTFIVFWRDWWWCEKTRKQINSLGATEKVLENSEWESIEWLHSISSFYTYWLRFESLKTQSHSAQNISVYLLFIRYMYIPMLYLNVQTSLCVEIKLKVDNRIESIL